MNRGRSIARNIDCNFYVINNILVIMHEFMWFFNLLTV